MDKLIIIIQSIIIVICIWLFCLNRNIKNKELFIHCHANNHIDYNKLDLKTISFTEYPKVVVDTFLKVSMIDVYCGMLKSNVWNVAFCDDTVCVQHIYGINNNKDTLFHSHVIICTPTATLPRGWYIN